MRVHGELPRHQHQPPGPLSGRLPVLPLNVGLGGFPDRRRPSRGRRSRRGVASGSGPNGAGALGDQWLGALACLFEETRIPVECAAYQ